MQAILRDAAANGYTTACPAEKSGQDEFDFEYGEDFAKHIEAFHPTFCKVLVRYNPEGDEALNQRQSARLKRLSDYLHAKGRSLFMFELLVPAEKAQLDRVKGDKKAYDLETSARTDGAGDRSSSRMPESRPTSGRSRGSTVARTARRLWWLRTRNNRDKVGCIILGRGEDDEKVHEWLTTAASSSGFHRIRGRSHRLLGAAGCIAGQENDARRGRRRDRPPLPDVRRRL